MNQVEVSLLTGLGRMKAKGESNEELTQRFTEIHRGPQRKKEQDCMIA